MNIGHSGRTTRPESARREKLGTPLSGPSLTGHHRSAGVGRGLLNGCVMQCAVATSPSQGPSGPFRTAFRGLPEATVADAMGWKRRRQALKVRWCKTSLEQCRWSDARKLVRSRNQSHDLFAQHGEILKVLDAYGVLSLARGFVSENIRWEADPMRRGVGRPAIRLCCFLGRVRPHPAQPVIWGHPMTTAD